MDKISILHTKDNVGTVIRKLEKGESIAYKLDGESFLIDVKEDIPLGHKTALEDIQSGDSIVKYGEIIGQAVCLIEKGMLVHVHNVQSLRGRGDIRKGDKI